MDHWRRGPRSGPAPRGVPSQRAWRTAGTACSCWRCSAQSTRPHPKICLARCVGFASAFRPTLFRTQKRNIPLVPSKKRSEPCTERRRGAALSPPLASCASWQFRFQLCRKACKGPSQCPQAGAWDADTEDTTAWEAVTEATHGRGATVAEVIFLRFLSTFRSSGA